MTQFFRTIGGALGLLADGGGDGAAARRRAADGRGAARRLRGRARSSAWPRSRPPSWCRPAARRIWPGPSCAVSRRAWEDESWLVTRRCSSGWPSCRRCRRRRRVQLLERLAKPRADPVIGPLFGVDEEGDAAREPPGAGGARAAAADRAELTCYAALLEGLTGIWNAAVRGRGRRAAARVGPARRTTCLLRLQDAVADPGLRGREARSGRASGWPIRSRQDALLVQQCVVRLLLALRAMAEARGARADDADRLTDVRDSIESKENDDGDDSRGVS